MRRVVVTGIGAISPLGNTAKASWAALLNGECGVRRIETLDPSAFQSQIAGEVRDFDPAQFLPAKEARRFDRFVSYGVAAGMEALDDAGLVLEDDSEESNRAGCLLGSGIGGLGLLCDNYQVYLERGPRRMSPFLIPGSILNMAGGELAILRHLRGPNFSTCSACSSGLHAIGEGAWMIRRNDADIMVVGGCESAITPDALGGFGNMKALSTRNDDPKHASRPFDIGRDGFVLGEGAGVLVLEEYEHAIKRGAHIYCEVLGYGLSADAYHITTPSTDGPVRSMQMAIRHAGIAPEDIDYLNAHGTSTHAGDINESKAIREIFGEHADKLCVSSTKGATGHLLGAAGGLEAVFTVLAIDQQTVPPTINIEQQDPECVVNVVKDQPLKMPVRNAMKNNFGFGGCNATVIFGQLR